MKTQSEIKNLRASFAGTEELHRHWLPGVTFTDGVRAMAEECEAYWLLDVIVSHQCDSRSRSKIPDQAFQVWTLKVEDGRGKVFVDDGNGCEPVLMQAIPFTDYPLDEIKIWFVNGTMMLPSEY